MEIEPIEEPQFIQSISGHLDIMNTVYLCIYTVYPLNLDT